MCGLMPTSNSGCMCAFIYFCLLSGFVSFHDERPGCYTADFVPSHRMDEREPSRMKTCLNLLSQIFFLHTQVKTHTTFFSFGLPCDTSIEYRFGMEERRSPVTCWYAYMVV